MRVAFALLACSLGLALTGCTYYSQSEHMHVAFCAIQGNTLHVIVEQEKGTTKHQYGPDPRDTFNADRLSVYDVTYRLNKSTSRDPVKPVVHLIISNGPIEKRPAESRQFTPSYAKAELIPTVRSLFVGSEDVTAVEFDSFPVEDKALRKIGFPVEDVKYQGGNGTGRVYLAAQRPPHGAKIALLAAGRVYEASTFDYQSIWDYTQRRLISFPRHANHSVPGLPVTVDVLNYADNTTDQYELECPAAGRFAEAEANGTSE